MYRYLDEKEGEKQQYIWNWRFNHKTVAVFFSLSRSLLAVSYNSNGAMSARFTDGNFQSWEFSLFAPKPQMFRHVHYKISNDHITHFDYVN